MNGKIQIRRQLTFALGIAMITQILLSKIGGTTSDELLELGCTGEACKEYQHSGIDARCVAGVCECRELSSAKHVKCRPMVSKQNNIIAGPCPCTFPHAACNVEQDICYCKDMYMPSEDRRRCIPVTINLDGECEFDSQCQHEGDPFVVCHAAQKRCICKSGYVAHEGRCLSQLERDCANNTDCSNCGSAICVPEVQKCACAQNYVHAVNGTHCVLAAHYGATCMHNAQCHPLLGVGSICAANKCTCSERYYMVSNASFLDTAPKPNQLRDDEPVKYCAPLIVFGAYCRNQTDCQHLGHPAEEQSMECVYGECNCKAGYFAHDNLACVRNSFGIVGWNTAHGIMSIATALLVGIISL